MMKVWFLFLIAISSLAGCASLTQFPSETNDYVTVLRTLDTDYANALDRIYGKGNVAQTEDGATTNTEATESAFVPPNAKEQKRIRNAMIERRIAVIDLYFKEFQVKFVKENVRSDFGIALVGVGVGATGSLVPETTSQILSAVSGGLTGAQAAYSKAVLYDKAMSAFLAQMQASRKAIAAQIFQRSNLGIDQYPLWMARTDLDAYYFAGSLPGAILGTAADANVKEKQADEQIIKLTRPPEFTANLESAKSIGIRLKNLTPAKALSLAKKMEPYIQKRSQKLINIMNSIDPSKERLKNGQKAQDILYKWQIFDDRDSASMKQWTDALDAIEQ